MNDMKTEKMRRLQHLIEDVLAWDPRELIDNGYDGQQFCSAVERLEAFYIRNKDMI